MRSISIAIMATEWWINKLSHPSRIWLFTFAIPHTPPTLGKSHKTKWEKNWKIHKIIIRMSIIIDRDRKDINGNWKKAATDEWGKKVRICQWRRVGRRVGRRRGPHWPSKSPRTCGRRIMKKRKRNPMWKVNNGHINEINPISPRRWSQSSALLLFTWHERRRRRDGTADVGISNFRVDVLFTLSVDVAKIIFHARWA